MKPLYVNYNTNGWILKMQGFENLLCCCNDDKTIKVYDLKRNYELVEELPGHEDGNTKYN